MTISQGLTSQRMEPLAIVSRKVSLNNSPELPDVVSYSQLPTMYIPYSITDRLIVYREKAILRLRGRDKG
jgi:hypothetical protein